MIRKTKQFFCFHKYVVIGLANLEQSKDESYYLYKENNIICRKKVCFKCGKEGIDKRSI
jgi:hypothetical protein